MPGPIGNRFMMMLINSPLHFLLGPNFAVITVAGRRSGKAITTPVNVSWDGQAYIVISMRQRTWWRNLRGKAAAKLRVAGKMFEVKGETIERLEEVSAGLQDHFARNPRLARYFGVRFTPDSQVEQASLERAAAERVIIRLQPCRVSPTGEKDR
jgi:deazaflavin-dependent oxidoreductase (nitroreductase family)